MTVVKNKVFKLYKKLSHKIVPKSRRLLTSQEYTAQANHFTRQKLKELKSYCLSTECDSWKIIDSLENPQR